MLILAIDALDWNLFNKFECTPFLSKLTEKGLSGRLASSPVPLTPIAFGEFYTGQESFIMPNQPMRNIIQATYRINLGKTIFDDLSEKYRVGLIELPCLSKLREIGEFVIAGLTYDEHQEYNHEYRAIPFHFYQKYLQGYQFYGQIQCDLFIIPKQYNYELRRFEYMQKIIQDHPCDIVATYLRIIDVACHGTKRRDVVNKPKKVALAIHDLYQFIDTWTEILCTKIVNPDIILIFSDHGFNSLKKQGQDWRSHNYDGTYILHGTDQQGSENKRIWQLHWLVKNICVI